MSPPVIRVGLISDTHSLLRPQALLRLGLYSEIARRHIVAARSFIAQGGYQPTAV